MKAAAEALSAWLKETLPRVMLVVGAAVPLVGIFCLMQFVADDAISAWTPVYVAGAAGGLCFELMRNRWRLELPSDDHRAGNDAERTFAPFGALFDIAIFGRMTTGALAAPTFVVLVDALTANTTQARDLTSYLTGLAGRPDTIAWGVAAGFAAPAVWSMLETFIRLRGAAAESELRLVNQQVVLARAKLEKTHHTGATKTHTVKHTAKKNGNAATGAKKNGRPASSAKVRNVAGDTAPDVAGALALLESIGGSGPPASEAD